MTSVFISYSRSDRDFVKLLCIELERTRHDAWVDLEDIPPSADWEREIYAGIDGADNFVCVLSPEWLASQTCQMELAHAVAAHKRIIPLLRRGVQGLELPQPVHAANWIFFQASDDGDAAFRQLLFAIDTDLDYWHLASRMQVRATQWEQNRENASFVLRGKELAEAERWLAEGTNKQPSPTALQTRYITASRHASSRRQRTIITVLSTFLAIASLLATIASVQTVRVGQQNAQLTSANRQLFARALAGASSGDLVNQKLGQALLLANAATQQQDTFETRNVLLDALEDSSHLAATVTDAVSGVPSAGAAVAVQFTTDGKMLMYAENGQQGRITFWDTTTQHTRAQYSIHDVTYGAAMSPDGTLLATLSVQIGLSLRDAATGSQLALLAPASAKAPNGRYYVTTLDMVGPNIAFNRDGSRLAAVLCDSVVCTHPYIGVWNPTTREQVGKLPLDFVPELTALAFSPDGHSIAVSECGQVCQLERWDLMTSATALRYKHVLTVGDGAHNMRAIAFSSDGARLYTVGCATVDCGQGRILTWDASIGIRTANTPPIVAPIGYLGAIAFSPDGRHLVTTNDLRDVVLWDATTMQPIGAPLAGHEGPVNAIAFSPDGNYFATAGEDGKVLLWRIAPYTPYSLQPGQDLDASSQVAYSPDGKLLATANCDGIVRLWNSNTGKLLTRLQVHNAPAFCLSTLAFSPNSQLLAARLDDGSAIVWDVSKDEVLTYCGVCSSTADAVGSASEIAFSPDSQWMAVPQINGAGSHVALANLTTRKLTHTFTNLESSTSPGAAFSPDGKLLAVGSGGRNNTGITLWDLTQQKAAAVLQGSNAEVAELVFTHDGRHLVALDNYGKLTVWDVARRATIGSLDLQSAGVAGGMSLSLHPNGWLLAASSNQTIWLLDLRDLTHPQLYVHPLREPSYIYNVAFSPDGKLLAAAEIYQGVVVRSALLIGWQQQACLLATRNLSRTEWTQFFGPQHLPYTPICPGLPIPT